MELTDRITNEIVASLRRFVSQEKNWSAKREQGYGVYYLQEDHSIVVNRPASGGSSHMAKSRPACGEANYKAGAGFFEPSNSQMLFQFHTHPDRERSQRLATLNDLPSVVDICALADQQSINWRISEDDWFWNPVGCIGNLATRRCTFFQLPNDTHRLGFEGLLDCLVDAAEQLITQNQIQLPAHQVETMHFVFSEKDPISKRLLLVFAYPKYFGSWKLIHDLLVLAQIKLRVVPMASVVKRSMKLLIAPSPVDSLITPWEPSSQNHRFARSFLEMLDELAPVSR